jgi:hypothetical protein
MGYKILLLLLAARCVSSYTSITTQNCPAQFDAVSANLTTSNAAAVLGPFLYSGYQSAEDIAKVNSIVIGGNTAELDAYTSQMIVPYIIYGVVYLLFYLAVVACCLFERSCPPCEAIRRDLDADPYSKR